MINEKEIVGIFVENAEALCGAKSELEFLALGHKIALDIFQKHLHLLRPPHYQEGEFGWLIGLVAEKINQYRPESLKRTLFVIEDIDMSVGRILFKACRFAENIEPASLVKSVN